ncbi:hypothetical protein ACN38_g7309 [Penicillium nordicum]|uniref:Uncharacterized protein n=1 Tax=Penicillium nordicum TaxID=229535 RepID=A0A0M8P6P9_9EURO|nr:hypothetical protein ACN38_g7309 [Penicillium nordicum]
MSSNTELELDTETSSSFLGDLGTPIKRQTTDGRVWEVERERVDCYEDEMSPLIFRAPIHWPQIPLAGDSFCCGGLRPHVGASGINIQDSFHLISGFLLSLTILEPR